MSAFDDLDDNAVLRRAADALKKASSLPPYSTARAIQWAAFDAAMAELRDRAVKYAKEQLRRRGES